MVIQPSKSIFLSYRRDDARGEVGRVYDALVAAYGDVTRTERRIDGVWYNTVYTYDAQDRVSTVTYPSGRKITYLRDKAGRVFRVKQKVGGVETDVITGRGYRGDHQFITQTLGNGLKETRKYDLQGRMYELKLADGGTTVYFRHFDYDASGNVTARKVDASLNNPVYDGSFGYDVLDRLTSEDHGSQWQSPVPGEPVLYPTTFGYTDPDGGGWKANNGNRRQMTRNGSTTNLSYTSNSNRLTNDGSQSLTYDAAGNQTGRGTESWVYGPRGLIRQYRQSGSTVAVYTYDYRSLRSKKALTGAETIVYLYDLQGQLIAEYEDGILKREYVWLDGAPLAQIDATAGGESINWFTTDHLLTPRLGTDSSKEPVWQWDSYAFGEMEPYLPTVSSGTMLTVNLRFPGQYYDGESDSHYNWHRYFESSTGRYLSSDPIGLDGGMNLYSYALQTPLSTIDPDGRNPIAIGAAAIRICNKIPKCRKKLRELRNKAIETCKKIRCNFNFDKKGHPFDIPGKGKMLCMHYQINCWVKGVKKSGFKIHSRLPICWKRGDPHPGSRPPSTLP